MSPATSITEPSVIIFESREGIARALQSETKAHEVHLDFRHVQAVHSSDLSELVRYCVKMRDAEKRVLVLQLSPLVRQVFKVTRFFRLVDLFEGEAAAVS